MSQSLHHNDVDVWRKNLDVKVDVDVDVVHNDVDVLVDVTSISTSGKKCRRVVDADVDVWQMLIKFTKMRSYRLEPVFYY